MPAPTPTPVFTHGCVRCGAEIPLEEAMCERCNPLGLREPAASQVHGSVILAVGAAIVFLAVLARVSVAGGNGPFPASITSVRPDQAGLAVTVTVTNDGRSTTSTTCAISDPSLPGIGPETASIQTPRIEPGQTLTFDRVVTSLGTEPRTLAVNCGH
ncbi:MAG: hypothetical protein ACJ77N_06935 [Chloroflexota bacterium]